MLGNIGKRRILVWKGSTAWKVSKYGVISAPYFSVFSPNTGKYGPETTPYLDTFYAVVNSKRLSQRDVLLGLKKTFFRQPL